MKANLDLASEVSTFERTPIIKISDYADNTKPILRRKYSEEFKAKAL